SMPPGFDSLPLRLGWLIGVSLPSFPVSFSEQRDSQATHLNFELVPAGQPRGPCSDFVLSLADPIQRDVITFPIGDVDGFRCGSPLLLCGSPPRWPGFDVTLQVLEGEHVECFWTKAVLVDQVTQDFVLGIGSVPTWQLLGQFSQRLLLCTFLPQFLLHFLPHFLVDLFLRNPQVFQGYFAG